jgi:hypothetical protein
MIISLLCNCKNEFVLKILNILMFLIYFLKSENNFLILNVILKIVFNEILIKFWQHLIQILIKNG